MKIKRNMFIRATIKRENDNYIYINFPIPSVVLASPPVSWNNEEHLKIGWITVILGRRR